MAMELNLPQGLSAAKRESSYCFLICTKRVANPRRGKSCLSDNTLTFSRSRLDIEPRELEPKTTSKVVDNTKNSLQLSLQKGLQLI